MSRSRRSFLAATGAAVTSLGTGVAGCIGKTSHMFDGAAFDDESARGVRDEPTIGPKPWKAQAGIVMFSDPSCPACEQFEDIYWAKLKSDYIDPGTVGFTYRTNPRNHEVWGMPASIALDAAWDHVSHEAFWKLRRTMYVKTMDFYEDPIEGTVTWLNENTDADGDAVGEAARSGDYDTSVKEDREVADEAGFGVVPSYTVLREGEVVTVGHTTSYENLKILLGVD